MCGISQVGVVASEKSMIDTSGSLSGTGVELKIGEIREVISTGYFVTSVVGHRFTIISIIVYTCEVNWISLPPEFSTPRSDRYSIVDVLTHTKRAESYAVSQILSHYE